MWSKCVYNIRKIPTIVKSEPVARNALVNFVWGLPMIYVAGALFQKIYWCHIRSSPKYLSDRIVAIAEAKQLRLRISNCFDRICRLTQHKKKMEKLNA